MKITASKSVVRGEIAIPGSKSHTIRAAVAALLADGESAIRAPLASGDTMSCLKAVGKLGASVDTFSENGQTVWRVRGLSGHPQPPPGTIDLGNSGTSLRLLTAAVSLAKTEARFDGDASLRQRPMAPLVGALRSLGVTLSTAPGDKCPLSINGPLRGGEATIDGVSSQFLSALLFACPLAENDTVLNVTRLNEVPYVEMTLDWLKFLGVKVEYSPDLKRFEIPGRQRFSAFDRVIPADFSTATFAAAAAAVTRGEVNIRNLDFSDRQGDKRVFDYFEAMGARVERRFDATTVSCPNPPRGVELDLNATPDALPAMAVVACFAEGTTVLGNVPQARLKETDRIAVMTRELRALGAEVEEFPDGMKIRGKKLQGGVTVNGHDDHRVVMALAIAGMGLDAPLAVTTAEAAAVTYPDFVRDFQALGAALETHPN